MLCGSLALIAWLLLSGGYADQAENPYPAILNRVLDGRQASMRGDAFSFLQIALVKTICVVAMSVVLSFIVGVTIAVMQLVRSKILRFAGTCYVEAIRGIPIFVMLLFIYFGLRPMLRFGGESSLLNAFWSAVLALGLCYGSYLAEVIRAGILAIPVEEIEAASLEGTKMQVLTFVILPQALRIIMPALANECINLTKDSSLIGVITVFDLTQSAQFYAGSTFRYFQTYAMLALIYLVLSLILSRVQRTLETMYGDSKAHRH
ncbi:amino acid ABC transporter permease [soil metagenome]